MRKICFRLIIFLLIPIIFSGCTRVTAANRNSRTMYSIILNSFMDIDPLSNSNIKYIAIDIDVLNDLSENDKLVISTFLKDKRKVEVDYDSLISLEKKGLYNKEKSFLDGVLLSISAVEKRSETEFVITGSKFRSVARTTNIKCNVEYINGKWNVKSTVIAVDTSKI